MGDRWVSIYGPRPLPVTVPAEHLADGNQLLHGVSRALAGIDEHKTNVLIMVLYHANGGVMTAVDLEKSSDGSSLGAGLDVAWEKSGVADEAIQLVILGIRVSLGLIGNFATAIGMCGEVIELPGENERLGHNLGTSPLSLATAHIARKAWGATWEPLPSWE